MEFYGRTGSLSKIKILKREDVDFFQIKKEGMDLKLISFHFSICIYSLPKYIYEGKKAIPDQVLSKKTKAKKIIWGHLSVGHSLKDPMDCVGQTFIRNLF